MWRRAEFSLSELSEHGTTSPACHARGLSERCATSLAPKRGHGLYTRFFSHGRAVTRQRRYAKQHADIATNPMPAAIGAAYEPVRS